MLNPQSKIHHLKSNIRKYLPLIVLISGFIIIPLLALSAIRGPNECCILNHSLTDVDTACAEGAVIAANECIASAPTAPCAGPGGDCCMDAVIPIDNCVTEGNNDGDWIDPEDEPCDDCWCDTDDDGKNNANCAGDQNPDAGLQPITGSKNWGTCCIVDAIYNVTDWVFYVLLTVVVLTVIIASFLFLTAGGDPSKIKTAQSSLLYAGIGLILASLARVIPAIIKAVVS